MKILGIIYVIFEFLIEKQKEIYNNHRLKILKFILGLSILSIPLFIILKLLSPDSSEIKKDYLLSNNLSNTVKCYQTNNGIRTNNFRIYKGNEYRLVNVIYDKWDIYPKTKTNNGFYLGKCDILDNSGKIINIK